MNPIYKFTLSANGGAERQAFPVYGDDLAKDFELQTNEQFYRAKLSGKLTFVKDDFIFIESQSFDTQFGVKIYISYDNGTSWTQYWVGQFWKTDCEFDADNDNVTVTPEVVDQYTKLLAGLDKEFNLIDLAPEIVPVKLDKRPMVQVYVPGESAIACFLSGMWWEQECEAITSEAQLTATGDNKLNFQKLKTARVLEISGTMVPQLPQSAFVEEPGHPYYFNFVSDGYRFICVWNGVNVEWTIADVNDPTIAWGYTNVGAGPLLPYTVQLTPKAGSSATGTVTLSVKDISIYARYVCDVDNIIGVNTYLLPANDIVNNNRNYTRVVSYNFPDTIFFSSKFSNTPTPWGLYKTGYYYDQPAGSWYIGNFYPVARNSWGAVSYWFAFSAVDWLIEEAGRKEYTLRDTYPIYSVISVLLAQLDPAITHDGTVQYSIFLYGDNPISGINQMLFITPKSNVVTLGYDQPAQKAPITLKNVLDMLRDCFRCYWFIDEQNRFRIEHIEYFRRGGNYYGTPVIGRDLTVEEVTRNGKKWAFDTTKYQFDKPEMAARYQFGWMDDVTQLFEGNPIDIVSKYVTADNVEEIIVGHFTTDIDYILLNPNEISKDGFVLLSAQLSGGEYKLPYLTITLNGVDHVLQNAYVAFVYLQNYYIYDMPALNYRVNGINYVAQGVKKLKSQTLKFPAQIDPNMIQLIKTKLGSGVIQKLSLNLSSRTANATLKYDTE